MADEDPITFMWDDVEGVMRPIQRHMREAKRRFKDKNWYPMKVQHNQSDESRRHFFAVLRIAADTMSEGAEQRLGVVGMEPKAKAEWLRQWALVETGWFMPRSIPCETEGELQSMKGRVGGGGYAAITRDGLTLHVKKPRSQAMTSMNGTDFELSKRDVLEKLSDELGVKVAELGREAQRESRDARAY
jgi:hypothetical protein